MSEEALTILAREIVREAGIAQEDPEAQARLEGNKLAMEAAKTQLLVGSGLLVGMGAVAGIMPETSLASPSLYVAFALVVLSVYTGIMWMRDIAAETGRSEKHHIFTELFPNMGGVSSLCFAIGVGVFALYVLWGSPGDDPGRWFLSPGTPEEQARWLFAFLGLLVLVLFGAYLFKLRRWRKRQRAQESEPPSQSS